MSDEVKKDIDVEQCPVILGMFSKECLIAGYSRYSNSKKHRLVGSHVDLQLTSYPL
jgi:hypothetical protein